MYIQSLIVLRLSRMDVIYGIKFFQNFLCQGEDCILQFSACTKYKFLRTKSYEPTPQLQLHLHFSCTCHMDMDISQANDYKSVWILTLSDDYSCALIKGDRGVYSRN